MKTLSRSQRTGRHVCLRLLCHFPALSLASDPSVFPPILSVRCVPAILVPYPLPVPVDTLKGSGARFSKVPVTLRARNQIFKAKYKE